MAVLKRIHATDNGYGYVVDIGYHRGVINCITSSPHPRPVTMNGLPVTTADVEGLVVVIHAQFGDRGYTYQIIEEKIDFAAM